MKIESPKKSFTHVIGALMITAMLYRHSIFNSARLNTLNAGHAPLLVSKAKSNFYSYTLTLAKLNAIFIILFGLLHVADGVLTYFGLSYSNVIEVNPILNYFIELSSIGYSILFVKSLIIFIIFLIFINRNNIKGQLGTIALLCANVFYVFIVFNNAILVLAT